MEFIEKIKNIPNIELYLILFLALFTVWFILNTVKYYKGEKRKVKHLHRFAIEGEITGSIHTKTKSPAIPPFTSQFQGLSNRAFHEENAPKRSKIDM
jgi:hypothetical protein